MARKDDLTDGFKAAIDSVGLDGLKATSMFGSNEELDALVALKEERAEAAEAAAVDMARAQAFSAGYEAGEKAEREAIITHIGGRVDHVEDAAKWGGSKQYLQSLKGGVTELNHLAAAIRKRGEG